MPRKSLHFPYPTPGPAQASPPCRITERFSTHVEVHWPSFPQHHSKPMASLMLPFLGFQEPGHGDPSAEGASSMPRGFRPHRPRSLSCSCSGEGGSFTHRWPALSARPLVMPPSFLEPSLIHVFSPCLTPILPLRFSHAVCLRESWLQGGESRCGTLHCGNTTLTWLPAELGNDLANLPSPAAS